MSRRFVCPFFGQGSLKLRKIRSSERGANHSESDAASAMAKRRRSGRFSALAAAFSTALTITFEMRSKATKQTSGFRSAIPQAKSPFPHPISSQSGRSSPITSRDEEIGAAGRSSKRFSQAWSRSAPCFLIRIRIRERPFRGTRPLPVSVYHIPPPIARESTAFRRFRRVLPPLRGASNRDTRRSRGSGPRR